MEDTSLEELFITEDIEYEYFKHIYLDPYFITTLCTFTYANCQIMQENVNVELFIAKQNFYQVHE